MSIRLLMVTALLLIGAGPRLESASGKEMPMPTSLPASKPSTQRLARIVREAGRVYLAGLEDAEWGNQTERQDSGLACVYEILRFIGEDASYDEVMGFGGSAFRVQMSRGKMHPASPNAHCGRDTFDPALAAFGYRVTWLEIGMPDKQVPPEELAKVRQAIMRSIDAGIPVISSSEESHLIVGYGDAGETLLIRRYSPRERGYEVTGNLPWGVGIITRVGPRPPRRESMLASLKAAVEMAYTPAYKEFDSGFAAYKNWAEHLRGEVGMDEALGNGYTYGCLWNQRQMAFTFLRRVAGDFAPNTARHLKAAADQYERIYKVMAENRRDLHHPWMYMPWDLKGQWTAQQRQAQAAMLDEVAQIEHKAVDEIEQALKAEGITTIRPATKP